MHVLGTPPAFILSQDQTLRSNGSGVSPAFDLCLFLAASRPPSSVGRDGRGPIQRTSALVSLRFILASQYPVFKVPAVPRRVPPRQPEPNAQGDTLPSRNQPVKNFFRKLEKFFEGFRLRLSKSPTEQLSAMVRPRSPQARVLYITGKVSVTQWVISKNLKFFRSSREGHERGCTQPATASEAPACYSSDVQRPPLWPPWPCSRPRPYPCDCGPSSTCSPEHSAIRSRNSRMDNEAHSSSAGIVYYR